jgi:hypothetical protein
MNSNQQSQNISKPTFVVYIDESGDEGFRFNAGSSEWFVISAVIVRKVKDIETVKLIHDVRSLLNKPDKKPLHFRDMKHEQRLPFINRIITAPLRTVTVLVHKPSLKEPEKFQERYRLYFYTVRYLFERVSWFCRDHKTNHDAGDGSAQIVFSNRSGMSYDELKLYFKTLQGQTGLDVRIDWSVIKPEQIISFTAGKRMGLQIADAIASSFFYSVQSTKYGFTEDRYARMLKSVVYHRDGSYSGYGIKFWPRDVNERMASDERFGWFREMYK